MRRLPSLLAGLLIAAGLVHAQLEECPDLIQEGEGYYPAFAPPFNRDTTNGGWDADPPRFQPLDPDDEDLCGTIFRYLDGGLPRQDEDWFEFLSLDPMIWVVRVWTEDDRPLRFQLTDLDRHVQDCGLLFSGNQVALNTWPGAWRLGLLPAADAPPGTEIAWRLEFLVGGVALPFIPPNDLPAQAELIVPPHETETYNGRGSDLGPGPLDLSHLWQPWQGEFDPLETALGGDAWYRLDLGVDTPLQLRFNCGYDGDLLVFAAAGAEPGDLLLGGSTACHAGLSLVADFPAGSYLVAVAGTGADGLGLLQVGPPGCPAPVGLDIRRVGGSMELTWNAVPGADRYRVLAGPTPGALAPVAEVASTYFLEAMSPARPRRVYRVQAICGE